MVESAEGGLDTPSVEVPIDAIGESVCILDDAFTIVAVNSAWRRFAEENPPVPRNYGIGTNYCAICEAATGTDAGEARAFLQGLRAVLQGTEQHFRLEYGRHAPAKKRWFRASVVRFGDEAGYRLLVTHTDISREYRTSMLRTLERERSKEAVRTSDTKYRMLFASMKEGVFYQNADGYLEDVNEAALSMVGVTREEFLNRGSFFSGWDVITQDGRLLQPEEYPFSMALRRGTPVENMTIGVWNPRDRGYRWLSISAIPLLKDGAAAPAQVFVTIHDLTEWKEREDRLRYQSILLDQISDTIIATDLEGRITYVNRAMAVVLGRSMEELIGSTTELLGDDPLRGSTQRQITEATKRDGEWSGEVVNIAGDGHEIMQFVRTVVVRDEAGRPIGMCGIGTDITERKRAEEALRKSQERFRLMFELSDEGIFHSNPATGEILAANRAACAMLGLSEEEICRRGRGGVLDPQDPRGATAVGVRAAHGHVEAELRMVRGDGSTFEASISSAVYTLSDGSVRTDVLFRDVSQRRHLELALRKLSAAVEFSPLAVVITDRQGVIEYVNPRFEQVTGYARQEVLGKNPRVLQSGLTPRQVYEDLWEAVGRGAVWHGEFQNRKKDGSLFWEEAWIAPIPDPSGAIGHIVGMKEDISSRRIIERTLADQHAALGAFASHLEAARETERTMIAREVHDAFGQILSAIKLDAMMLAGSDMCNQEYVSRRALSIVELVEDGLKTVHEIAARLRPGILDNLGLVAALEWQAEEFQRRTGIRCRTTLPEADVDLDAETATTIFRCAQALMTNVLLHAQARSVTLTYEHGNGPLILVVADDGKGIDPACVNNPRSYGLIGIRERARSLGGTFTIGPGADSGTLARVTIPVRGQEVQP